jgi:hypothetical protein
MSTCSFKSFVQRKMILSASNGSADDTMRIRPRRLSEGSVKMENETGRALASGGGATLESVSSRIGRGSLR